jgi:hypothetical protein
MDVAPGTRSERESRAALWKRLGLDAPSAGVFARIINMRSDRDHSEIRHALRRTCERLAFDFFPTGQASQCELKIFHLSERSRDPALDIHS